MRTPLILALALACATPAVAQTGTPRQPTGALVPSPAAPTSTTRDAGATLPSDSTPGTVRSRDTRGLPQSPENRNVFGCKQIDPLCQGGQ